MTVSGLIKHSNPWLSSLLGAGIGAAGGYLTGQEGQKKQRAIQGALLGGAGGALVSPRFWRGARRYGAKSRYNILGTVPKKWKPTGELAKRIPKDLPRKEQYLHYLHEGSPTAIGNFYRKIRLGKDTPKYREAIQAIKTDPIKKAIEADKVGMGSLRDMASTFAKDPKQFAKKWYRHGGRKELQTFPLWMAMSYPEIKKAQPGKDRRAAFGQALGSTAGWAALGRFGMPVWATGSALGGALGKRIGGIGGKRSISKPYQQLDKGQLRHLVERRQ